MTQNINTGEVQEVNTSCNKNDSIVHTVVTVPLFQDHPISELQPDRYRILVVEDRRTTVWNNNNIVVVVVIFIIIIIILRIGN